MNLDNVLPLGVTFGFDPPCKAEAFSESTLTELFKEKLPSYLAQLKQGWESTDLVRTSGLTNVSQAGPFDASVVGEDIDAETWFSHGGTIPILGGAPGSRGIPEAWPYKKVVAKWARVGHPSWRFIGEVQGVAAKSLGQADSGSETLPTQKERKK